MDSFAHALYGITFFSRIGFAGFLKSMRGNAPKLLRVDWTIWAAGGFAVLPDLASIGIYFLELMFNAKAPSFHHLPRYVFDLYNLTHSLLVAGLVCLILWKICKPLFVPSLAWILHIVMDIFSHGYGRFQTPFLYPLSDYAFNGLNWWQTPWLTAAYWGALPLLWAVIYFLRRRQI